jgi:hypothetical protein
MEYKKFAGVYLSDLDGWLDITHELPTNSPSTLSRNDGIGVLQFSVAKFRAGTNPRIGSEDLSEMLKEFGESRSLGEPLNVSVASGRVSGDFIAPTEFIRVWYVTNGSDVALVTYVTEDKNDPKLSRELAQATEIVSSIRFP